MSVDQKLYPTFLKDPKEVLLQASLGLTYSEAENILAKVASRDKCLSRKALVREKAEILAQDGIIQYFEPKQTSDDFGGYEIFSETMAEYKEADCPEGKAFGCGSFKGSLLAGEPGTGKTAQSKALANRFGVSAAEIRLGSIFDKFVGESESKCFRMFDTLLAMRPIVVIFDEIESCWPKQGEGDSGISGRIGGQILSFMAEDHPGLTFMFTSNDPRSLPPALSRKGRLDEVFYFGLPNQNEREDIFRIHIGKVGRDPAKFDLRSLAEGTEGFSGADIEELVKTSLRKGFLKNRTEPTTDLILHCAKDTTPASVIYSERIKEISNWCKTHGVVSASKKYVAKSGEERKKRAIKY